MDLEADCPEDSIYQHLLYIRHFLWGLRGQASPESGPAQPDSIEVEWGRCTGGEGPVKSRHWARVGCGMQQTS